VKLEAETLVEGRYRLLARLGSGGMADVWCAQDTLLDRRVALKFLHERFAQDQQFVERFRREASAAAGLQHPNVVGVFDRGEESGRQFIAMEYVEGASLKDLIGRGLSVGEAIEIIRQVLQGARFAHSRGIVHRDLKPQNVLVDAEGRALVADFGIARAGVSEITQTGSVLGTAHYLSPEQAQGLAVTAASDLYSVGVMLYEALTGRLPFEGDSPVTVALKQVSERPRPPSEINPAVSKALDAVVLKALAKDPANRFASAEEFIRALDAAESDPSGGALGDTASFAPVPVPVVEDATPPTVPVLAADPVPPPPPTGRRIFTRNRLIALGVLLLLLGGALAYALTRPDTVRVPGVTSQQLGRAQAALQDAGFEVVVNRVPRDAPVNQVIEQNPRGGTSADEGSTVTLTVSSGLGQATVPLVAGEPEKQAHKELSGRGFRVKVERQASEAVKSGLAIGTQPGEGAQIDLGTRVTLLISQGPKIVTVPSMTGIQQEIAESRLRSLGLIPNVDSRNSDEPEGTVIDQDPAAGSKLRKHSEVTIVVSTGAGSVIMPDVVGQSEDGAKATLHSRGLSVIVQDQQTNDQGQDGRVTDQAPEPGARMRRGDQVTIVVGKFVEPPPTTTSSTTSTTK
jgi:beta-lactam-binding protein with PASTA domain/tRNA A-37 threonylcarbamoyl transferase component Bud32